MSDNIPVPSHRLFHVACYANAYSLISSILIADRRRYGGGRIIQSQFPDDKPVTVKLKLAATLHRDLVLYAEVLARKTQQPPTDASETGRTIASTRFSR